MDRAGSLEHPFLEKKVWPSEVIKILHSRVTVTGNSAYYSERYHSRREDDETLRRWLASDLRTESGRGSDDGEDGGNGEIERVARELDLVDLLDASTMNLSNGQTKRATIAKALLARPRVLLLDEPYVGLDKGARRNLDAVLAGLIGAGRTRIVLALRPLDEIPGWATHVLWLRGDGTTRYVGPAETILPDFEADLCEKRARIKNERTRHHGGDATEEGGGGGGSLAPPLVELKSVDVSYWGKPVLQSVSWTIRPGESWLVQGSNGSGKTTLLAMILGDHPKSYANEIHLFGKRRGVGDGRSVGEVQAEMGHTSPELHRHFPRHRTGRECVASAFGETLQPPKTPLTGDQVRKLEEVVAWFGVTAGQLDRRIGDHAPAMQRLFLLLRALVKKPKLLILDEPFAGMDEGMIARAKAYLDASHADPERQGQAVLFVTHYEDEVPASVDRILVLDKGRVVEMR